MSPQISGTPTYHLPPVKAPTGTKKKSSKHCFLCGKKTGLASSYECRYQFPQAIPPALTLSHTGSLTQNQISPFVTLVLDASLLVESGLSLFQHFCLLSVSPVKTHLCSLLVLPQVINIIKVSPYDINLDNFPPLGFVQGEHTESDATVCNCNLLTAAIWNGAPDCVQKTTDSSFVKWQTSVIKWVK